MWLLFPFFALNVFSFFSSFQFLQNLRLRMYSVFFSLTFFFFEYFPLWRRFCNFCFTYNLLSWLFRWVSSLTSSFPPCFISWVHYRGNKVWLTMIFLFRIIIWIILGYSGYTFEAFLRHKFSQNSNYKSSTVRFTNKVERGWRTGLHVKMSESSLENAVLDRRRFYEMKFSSLKPLDYSANLI